MGAGSVTKRLVMTALTVGVATAAFAGAAGAGAGASGEVSKKRYLKEANSTCKAASKELAPVYKEVFVGLEGNEQPSTRQAEEFVARAAPIWRGMLDDIEALEGPAELDKKVDTLLDKYRDVIDVLEADPKDTEYDPFAQLDKKLTKFGLKVCVERI